ncbi:sigma-70 family RNA polymerase sigma factor [bacterium]|nr:sigma-70 family RNA polymerase sigma factor [bacterium]MBU0899900.1 sigma-70 family RNA polymerase sigma factor [bacterium]MBU1152970.1 sigma-70 family RNA polymerase sigma factor [bacterium]MBU2599674.1 sigma-70 family RNA polymerase sigma factor [bacterium]
MENETIKLPDLELVKKSKQGNFEAFTELIKRYEAKIYSLAYNYMQNREDAEDILQETFLKVYVSLPNFREEAKFVTWLYRICVNTCYSKLREKKVKVVLSLESSGAIEEEFHREIIDWSKNPEACLLAEEMKEVLNKAIEKLPREYKEVFILRDIEELSNKEASEVLGESIAAIKARVHRARLFVREEIAAYFKKDRELIIPPKQITYNY